MNQDYFDGEQGTDTSPGDLASRVYEKRMAEYQRMFERRKQLEKKNDKRLAEVRKKNDARLKGNHRRKKRLQRHRAALDKRRKKRSEQIEALYQEATERERNRLRRRKADKKKRLMKKKILILCGGCGILVFVFFLFQFLIPGSSLKKKEIIDDTPIGEMLDAQIFPDKPYDTLDGISEQQLLYTLLLDHFEGNKAAVLGVMCNLHAESNFEAANLEDYNNDLWGISDADYTEEVNRKTIDKKDFLESRRVDTTNGYLNGNNLWVNLDGGYGYAQYTAYDKKEAFYQFAEQWFAPGGPGEAYRFNIGDPKMQAQYIIQILNSNAYHEMNDLIAHAKVPVDACYYWLKMYEEPYDPYCDGYYTLAFERAAVADEIEAICGGVIDTADGGNGAVDGNTGV